MSVELHDVTKRIGRGQYTIVENLNLRIDVGERVGILGQPKSGKTTLLRMICGTEPNYEGVIERNSSVSWPIPFGEFLVPTSTVATNIRFIGRLCGVESKDFAREIAELADVTEFLNEEMGNCPSFVRQQLSFAIGVGTKFDIYLFDETVLAGKKEFKEKAHRIVRSLTPRHGILLATSAPKEVEMHCDTVFVLDNGHATYYRNVADGIKHHKSIVQSAGEEQAARQERGEMAQEDTAGILGI